MSNHNLREQLIAAVMRAVAAFQDATDQVDGSAAGRLGLNRTDLRCLGILTRAGRMTAGQLAAAAGLSAGAATTAVDRLARAGYAERVRDEQDRRRVTVQATGAAHARSAEIWGPIAAESHRWLSRRDDAELRLIRGFLEDGARLQAAHAARIQAERSPSLRRRG